MNIALFYVIPKGFFPQQDTGILGGSIQAAQDISFDAMRKKQRQFSEIVMTDPAVYTVVSFVGGNGGTINTGRMFITLKPLSERKVSADQVIQRLRRKLAVVPGATLYLQAQQDIRVGGRSSNSQYQFTLDSENLDDLNRWSPRMLAKLKTLPQLRDVATDQQDKGLEAELVIDRDTASRLGIPAQTIDNTLYDAFGQRQVSIMYETLNEYHVVLEVDPSFQEDPDALKSIYVRSATGAQVPLSAFTHFESRTTALAVNHQGQFPAVTLSFNLALGVALGDAVDAIENAERDISLPSTDPCQLPGNGAGVSGLAIEPAHSDSRGARGRVHRPGHALRELHPSDYDSLHASFRRHRRDSGAAALRNGLERDRLDRHHPADWHREEECDHDD